MYSLPVGGRIGDLGLCVNGNDASQERTITDPSLSSDEEIHMLRFPNVAKTEGSYDSLKRSDYSTHPL